MVNFLKVMFVMERRWSIMRKGIWTVFLFFLFLGFYYEEKILIALNLSISDFGLLFLGFSILFLVYLLPISYLTTRFLCKDKRDKLFFILSLLAGAYIIGSLAGILNFQMVRFIRQMIGHSSSWLDQWAGSIVPPVIEETLKALLAAFLIYMSQLNKLSQWVMIGIGVGLGFQLNEDFTYLYAVFVDSDLNFLTELIKRLEIVYVSHYFLTGILLLGIGLLIKKGFKNNEMKIVSFIFGPILLHFLWNSPWLTSDSMLQIGVACLLTVCVWFGYYAYQVLKEVIQEEEPVL